MRYGAVRAVPRSIVRRESPLLIFVYCLACWFCCPWSTRDPADAKILMFACQGCVRRRSDRTDSEVIRRTCRPCLTASAIIVAYELHPLKSYLRLRGFHCCALLLLARVVFRSFHPHRLPPSSPPTDCLQPSSVVRIKSCPCEFSTTHLGEYRPSYVRPIRGWVFTDPAFLAATPGATNRFIRFLWSQGILSGLGSSCGPSALVPDFGRNRPHGEYSPHLGFCGGLTHSGRDHIDSLP